MLALTQILNVGTVALVSHAVGAQERERANHIFNQALLLSLLLGAIVFAGVFIISGPYMHTVAADEATARAGISYLYWFAPGLALQFIMVAMFATLRATGMVKPTMILQVVSVLVNVLAPVLIVGWGTGSLPALRARDSRGSITANRGRGRHLSVLTLRLKHERRGDSPRPDGSSVPGRLVLIRSSRRARVLPDVDRDGRHLTG